MNMRELKNKYAGELRAGGVKPLNYLDGMIVLLLQEILEKLDKKEVEVPTKKEEVKPKKVEVKKPKKK